MLSHVWSTHILLNCVHVEDARVGHEVVDLDDGGALERLDRLLRPAKRELRRRSILVVYDPAPLPDERVAVEDVPLLFGSRVVDAVHSQHEVRRIAEQAEVELRGEVAALDVGDLSGAQLLLHKVQPVGAEGVGESA